MTGRTFWVLSFVLMVIASHLAYILFGTRFESRTHYQDLVAVAGANKVLALSDQQARQLSSTSDNNLVIAVCAYDLSGGPVKLSATFPEAYWSVNIYSLNGDVIYTLNDRQADASELSIIIGLVGEKKAAPVAVEPDAAPAPAGSKNIQVLSDTPRGLAVLRSSIVHAQQRKRSSEILSQSECSQVSS